MKLLQVWVGALIHLVRLRYEFGRSLKRGLLTFFQRLARSIYMAFKTDKRRNYLIAEDFYPAYPTPAEAEEAFHVFDADSNG